MLKADVQARLDGLFGRPVLVLTNFRRQGSAPFAAAADGARQAIVYYNATLEFAEPYDPSDWEGLSPQLIALALGATDQGVIGLESDAMLPGSRLWAYGSLVYSRDGEHWRASAIPVLRSESQTATGVAQTSRADELIERLANLVDTTPALRDRDDAIVAEELDRALQNIRLRLDAGAEKVVVATGPEGGEYARFMASVAGRLGAASPIRLANTEGSVANAFLIEYDQARFGLVQSDVAAAAVTGEGSFAATGPLSHLRGVASLFPEPLHVVVRADAGIESVTALASHRVVLGAAGSGTRLTARRVLVACGLEPGSYVEVNAQGPADALARLAAGEVDAVVEVVSAPWRQLWQVSRDTPLRLLPLGPQAIGRIDAEVHGVVPMVIPGRTYPGQAAEVPTVAATALLVARSTVPEAIVSSALDAVFAGAESPGRGVSAARVSRRRALAGVTIPLHDGAVRYFESARDSVPAGR